MQIGTSTSNVAWEGFDEQTLDWYRTYVRLHLRLWPYLWTYAARLAEGFLRAMARPPSEGGHGSKQIPIPLYWQRTSSEGKLRPQPKLEAMPCEIIR